MRSSCKSGTLIILHAKSARFTNVSFKVQLLLEAYVNVSLS
jgi:hypothetical protein